MSHEEELFSTKAFRGSVSFHVIHSCLIRLGKHTSLTITPIFRLHPPSQKLYWKLGQQSAICWNSLGPFKDYGLNHIYLEIFFLFFKIESWNFQHLFEKEFRESSQKFQLIQLIQTIFIFLSVVWLNWNFVGFHFSNRCWNKKVVFLKKLWFKP